jgi:hypothetical protein
VDEDNQRFELFAGGHETHPLPSVMGGAYGKGSHHLVSFGYLLLDDVAAVGVGGMIFGDLLQVALADLAGGLLAGKQVVIDEVGGQHLLQGV